MTGKVLERKSGKVQQLVPNVSLSGLSSILVLVDVEKNRHQSSPAVNRMERGVKHVPEESELAGGGVGM